MKKDLVILRLYMVICMLFICFPSELLAQTPTVAPSVDEKNSQVQFDQAVASAGEVLGIMEKDLTNEKKLLEEVLAQQQIYRTQINSLRNFLIVPDISASVIGKGLEEVDISTTLIQSWIQKAEEREARIRQNLTSVQEKILLMNARIKDGGNMSVEAVDRAAEIKKFKAYRTLLEKQQNVLLSTLDVLSSGIKAENDLFLAFKDIRVTLKREMKDRKGGRLLQRNEIELKTFLAHHSGQRTGDYIYHRERSVFPETA